MDDSAWQKMKIECLSIDDNRVTCIISTLTATDDVSVCGQHVNHLAFPFVAPLGAKDHYHLLGVRILATVMHLFVHGVCSSGVIIFPCVMIGRAVHSRLMIRRHTGGSDDDFCLRDLLSFCCCAGVRTLALSCLPNVIHTQVKKNALLFSGANWFGPPLSGADKYAEAICILDATTKRLPIIEHYRLAAYREITQSTSGERQH